MNLISTKLLEIKIKSKKIINMIVQTKFYRELGSVDNNQKQLKTVTN